MIRVYFTQAAAVIVMASSCSLNPPPAVRERIEAAERLYVSQRYDKAVPALDAARRLDLPENWAAEVSFLYARALMKAGRVTDGRTELSRIARTWPEHPKAPRSLYWLAETAATRADAERRFVDLARRYPSTDPARDAVRWIVNAVARDDDEPARAVRILSRLYRRDPWSSLCDLILYELAQIVETAFKDDETAEWLYRKVINEWGLGGFGDDARWRLAKLLRRGGRYEELIRHLRVMMAERRPSWALGSYNPRVLEPSQVLLARVFLEDLRLYDEAREVLDAFDDGFPNSPLRREVGWLRVQSYAAEGRTREARTALEALLREQPDTRFGRKAKRVLDGLAPLPLPKGIGRPREANP
ncbi:MAG: tetratricopeptide repeat protein [Deltaproteobacteria bacterium]|nr:tetratricopeptide repeat protein [Deltaproteobacteria bacterium]